MPTELQITWGKHLREVRTAKGISGSELAQKVGVTRQHIQRIETGQSAASVEVWICIADALGVDLTALVGDEVKS